MARCDPHAEGGERFLAPENGSAWKMDPQNGVFFPGNPSQNGRNIQVEDFYFCPDVWRNPWWIRR